MQLESKSGIILPNFSYSIFKEFDKKWFIRLNLYKKEAKTREIGIYTLVMLNFKL